MSKQKFGCLERTKIEYYAEIAMKAIKERKELEEEWGLIQKKILNKKFILKVMAEQDPKSNHCKNVGNNLVQLDSLYIQEQLHNSF